MSYSDESNSDMDMVEESEDELNTTTYFQDGMEKIVEESSDADDNDDNDDDIKALIEHDDEHIKQLLEDNYTEVPMDIDPSGGPMETRKSHMITCPVCFEISILSKHSKLYDNLIAACMEKSSKK